MMLFGKHGMGSSIMDYMRLIMWLEDHVRLKTRLPASGNTTVSPLIGVPLLTGPYGEEWNEWVRQELRDSSKRFEASLMLGRTGGPGNDHVEFNFWE
ncbi:MAG: hypothetical protein ACLU4N_00610 [Butyricimonas faecihominis]